MSRYNVRQHTGTLSPIATLTGADGLTRTSLGGSGHLRDPRSELFLLAVSSLVKTGDNFHESALAQNDRLRMLVAEVADDVHWLTGFIGFLRDQANLRTISLIVAAQAVHARLAAGRTGNRALVSAALRRADEPGEFLAYWNATFTQRPSGHNAPLPKPVRRGVADAVDRLYTERAVLKYDTASKGIRFSDVLRSVHPDPLSGRLSRADYRSITELDQGIVLYPETMRSLIDRGMVTPQGSVMADTRVKYHNARVRTVLYQHILDVNKHGKDAQVPQELSVLRAREDLDAVPVVERRGFTTGQLAQSGITWEAYSAWINGPMDAAAWEKCIPNMGYMALLRNLRNFDAAKISRASARWVEDVLTDPEQVARSRQLPMRFLSAYRATRDARVVSAWGPVIEQALNLSLANVPKLSGRTLVLTDLSQSMYDSKLSDRSDLRYVDAAAVFSSALALTAQSADLFGFGFEVRAFEHRPGDSLLPLVDRQVNTTLDCTPYGHRGIMSKGLGGTDTIRALTETYREGAHDRIVIVTDEQYQPGGWDSRVKKVDEFLDGVKVPVYTWNLAGYRAAQAVSGSRRRHTFGGLNDAAFRLIPLIEAGQRQDWDTLFHGDHHKV